MRLRTLFRSQYMRADRLNDRIKCNNTGADPIGERRCGDLDTFPRIGVALPVQRKRSADPLLPRAR